MLDKGNTARVRERGSMLIMVLILLTMGSLIIPPWLKFLETSLRASRDSNDQLALETSANAGVRHAINRLQTNDGGFADLLNPDNPSAAYTVQVNGMEVFIEVDIPQVPDPPPPPEVEPGPHLYVGKSRSVRWIKLYEAKVFTYTLNAVNYGTSSMHIGEVGDIIPWPFRYVAGSSSGISTDDPAITMDNNRQILTWVLPPPYPKLNSGQTRTQTFQVIHVPGGAGIHYNDGWAVDYPKSVGKVPSGPTAAVAISVYKIHARVRSTFVVAEVAVGETESTILSWQ